jgi:hypothetical protein
MHNRRFWLVLVLLVRKIVVVIIVVGISRGHRARYVFQLPDQMDFRGGEEDQVVSSVHGANPAYCAKGSVIGEQTPRDPTHRPLRKLND